MANSVDPDETARDEPSHLDPNCLRKCLFGSESVKYGTVLNLEAISLIKYTSQRKRHLYIVCYM